MLKYAIKTETMDTIDAKGKVKTEGKNIQMRELLQGLAMCHGSLYSFLWSTFDVYDIGC